MGKENIENWVIADDLPEDPLPFYPVASPGAGETLEVYPLENKIVWIQIHWYRGRTEPCKLAGGYCEPHEHEAPLRWKGYLPAVLKHPCNFVLAEITPEAKRGCKSLQAKPLELRGKLLRLTRAGKNASGRVDAVVTDVAGVLALPEPFDCLKAIERMYSAPRRTKRIKREKGPHTGQPLERELQEKFAENWEKAKEAQQKKKEGGNLS